jgi:hypothetical protein
VDPAETTCVAAALTASRRPQWAVVVAVAAVHVVKMAIDQVIGVIAMRHHRMSAGGAVDVIGGMAGAAMVRCALGGVGRVDRNRAFIDVIAVDLVQVPIVEVVDMAGVLHREMAAAGTVDMVMGWVNGVRHETSYGAVTPTMDNARWLVGLMARM